MEPNYNGNTSGKPFPGSYPSRLDIDKMPETPQRGFHHRRAQSDNFLLEDDIFDIETDFNFSGLDIPSMSEENDDSGVNSGGGFPMAVDSGKSVESNGGRVGGISPFRSLSVGADFFDGLGFQPSPIVGGASGGGGGELGGNGGGVSERRKHRHSNSMDGSSSSFEVGSGMFMDYAKKVTGPDRLAELALIDPKRAKRILANRQSAARSKERKTRYTDELERKVQTLQAEATTLSAQVTMLQKEQTGLNTENKELKLRLQALEEQTQLRDALHETLRDEVNRLRLVAAEFPSVHGNSFNRGPRPQFFSNSSAAHQFGVTQTQQHQPHVPQSSPNNQVHGGQPQHGSLNFHQRV